MSQNTLSSRYLPIVAQLNNSEIAIIGGVNNAILSDVVIFETKTKKCKKTAEGGEYKFYSQEN